MRRLAAPLCLLLLAAAAPAVDDPAWELQALCYAHNLEFTKAGAVYHEGRTFFGQQLAGYAVLTPAPDVRLGAGLLLDVVFGRDTEENWEAVEPWVFLELYPDRPTTLRFGNLDKRDQVLRPAVLAPEVRYLRPAERGLGLRHRGASLSHDTWLHWRVQETAERREQIDAGSRTSLRLGHVTLEAQGHVVHHGGQLSSHGPVKENWAFALGGVWEPPLGDGGWTGLLAAHGYLDRGRRWVKGGEGVEARVGAARHGLSGWIGRWHGDGYLAYDGRPFYRADGFTSWGLGYEWDVGGVVGCEVGFIGYHLDEDFEQEFWVVLDLPGVVF